VVEPYSAITEMSIPRADRGLVPWNISGLIQESCAIAKWPRDARFISGSNEPLRRYGHLKLSKMAACRQLGFDVTGNSAIRSANRENPTLEPNMKCIGSLVAEIWPFAYHGASPHMELPFGGRRRRRDQRWHHSKERWWFSIGSPLWPLNVSDAQINRWWVTLSPKFRLLPLE